MKKLSSVSRYEAPEAEVLFVREERNFLDTVTMGDVTAGSINTGDAYDAFDD